MLAPLSRVKVYVFKEPCDLRKGIDGLSGLVRNKLAQDPLTGHCFCFFNRKRDQIKVLYWDRTGYCVWMKRLTKGSFPLVAKGELVPSQLFALLEGAKREDLERTESKRYSYLG